MNDKDITAAIEKMDDGTLAQICKEIYDWRYVSGSLCENSKLLDMVRELPYNDIKFMEKEVLRVAHERFAEIVLLLFQDMPGKYLIRKE